MTKRSELRELCRRRLDDLSIDTRFSNLQLNQWINDGIADYSVHFPRELTAQIELTAGTYTYSLATLVGMKRVLKVEYPYGEDPPEYLYRLSERDNPVGFYGHDCYDLVGEPPETLILGPVVSTGEKVSVTYQADHDWPAGDSTVITVPDRHLELIVLFVRMCAAQSISSKENMNPQVTTLLSSTLSMAARRCEQEYRGKLAVFKEADSPGGQVTSWEMDEHGKIY